jgi:hypothetical protein
MTYSTNWSINELQVIEGKLIRLDYVGMNTINPKINFFPE